MELVGYARVSTREDCKVFDRQADALRAAGCERIYDDRGSGASTDRPGLKACLDYLRRSEVLVVLYRDRLGRLAGELIRLVDGLEARDVGFRALNASFATTTPMAAPSRKSRRRSPRWSATSSASGSRRALPPRVPADARAAARG